MDERAKTNLTIIAVSMVCIVLGAIFGWARANKPSRDNSVELHSTTESSEYKSTTNNSTTLDSDGTDTSSAQSNGTTSEASNSTTWSKKIVKILMMMVTMTYIWMASMMWIDTVPMKDMQRG